MKNLLKHSLIALGMVVLAQGAMAAGDAAAGEAKAAVCGACHGADGNSLVPTFPKLSGLGEKYITKQLRDIQAWDNAEGDAKEKTGRAVPEMVGQLANSSDQDLQDLAAYYNSQKRQISGAKELQVKVNAGIKVDAIKLGTRVYRGGNAETGVPACTGCHSPRGLGNGPAGYPNLSGQHAAYIEKQLRHFRAGERTNGGDTRVMRQVAEHMSDAEIIAVANYISGLH